MDKLKMILKDNTFIRHTFFIVFNAILLYILYFLKKTSVPSPADFITGSSCLWMHLNRF